MDFVLDYISVNTFWTILSTTHALLAVALLGALTHQAAAVLAPPRAGAAGGFVTHFRSVSGPRYAAAVCVLWGLVFIVGAWIYARYRLHVRILIEQEQLWRRYRAYIQAPTMKTRTHNTQTAAAYLGPDTERKCVTKPPAAPARGGASTAAAWCVSAPSSATASNA